MTRHFLLVAFLLVVPAAVGQSGLPSRPLNLTCVAPDPIVNRYLLEPVTLAQLPAGDPRRGDGAGLLYRGTQGAGLKGFYLYVEEGGHGISARLYAGHGYVEQRVVASDLALDGLLEDDRGDVYALSAAGPLLLRADGPDVPEDFPLTLSATGCFEALDVSQPTVGLIPFAPAAPLYSDNALKRRWIAMPDWNAAGTQIGLTPDGDFEFPAGTVLVKEFALGATIVETRLFVHHLDGIWRGYSYAWNAAQTDADLLSGSSTADINGQTWSFPNSFECDFCHSDVANKSLGPEIAQLNDTLTYPSTGLTANQLETLDAIGLIAGGLPGPVATLDALPHYDDETVPVDERARGYLHSNCAGCHQPGGPGQGPMDFRYFLDGSDIGSNNVVPQYNMGVPGALIIKRGFPEGSIVPLRMRSTFIRMPPLGVSILDTQGVELIERWIRSGLGFGVADSDADEFTDDLDNCSALANADQRDSDGDGFGNACDADLNNDNIVNVVDLGLFKARFFSTDADADFNGDGVVNAVDLGILKSQFFGAPGPGATT